MSDSFANTKNRVEHMATKDAYDKWAPVYDHDGNVMQALDDVAIDANMSKILALPAYNETHQTMRIMDMGCGTGRNTMKLFLHASTTRPVHIVAVDNSNGMLSQAQTKLSSMLESQQVDQRANNSTDNTTTTIEWIQHDISDVSTPLLNKIKDHRPVHIIISTLVLEHITLPSFFSTVQNVLAPGGILFLTNMHPEMGAISGAGFVDPSSGVKIKPVSINHGIGEIVKAAEDIGLHLQDVIQERGVADEQEAVKLGSRAHKWIGVKIHVAIVFIMSS